MASAAASRRYTPEEYLALERKADFKSEYFNGHIFAMAGTSRLHNMIAGNLYSEIKAQLRGRGCEIYFSDVRVCVSPTGLFTYPDVVVVCGERRFLDDEFDTLLNPTAIIEVLSPCTEAYDRGEKFAHYRRLESLREYVLVAQDRVRVERFTRQGDDWVLRELSRPEDVLQLASIGCAVGLNAIYAELQLPEARLRPEPDGSAGWPGEEP
jgi:Uma2 family endonuclease